MDKTAVIMGPPTVISRHVGGKTSLEVVVPVQLPSGEVAACRLQRGVPHPTSIRFLVQGDRVLVEEVSGESFVELASGSLPLIVT